MPMMDVREVMAQWSPGSQDPPWTWADEERDLLTQECPSEAARRAGIDDAVCPRGRRHIKHATTKPKPRKKKPTRRCSKSYCDRKHEARGYCRKHYQRLADQERKAARGIVGGIDNTVCKADGCRGAAMGGGLYCSNHFWTEIVVPGRKRRGEL